MKKNFWQELKKRKKPILALAPLAGITDSPFRQICKDFGAEVVYSEMASATALVYAPKKTLDLIKFKNKERPYVVQLFGACPDHFQIAIKLIEKKLKPDGIDINFGCPVSKVMKQGAGAELMKNLALSREIILAVLKSATCPISIKTRTLAGNIRLLKFLKNISDLKISALMIHGRTLSQGFSGPINFKIIKQARCYFSGIILANGGIKNCLDGREMIKKTQADGLGIGRGALGRPWIFQELSKPDYQTPEKKEIFKLALKQANLIEKTNGKQGIMEMRKHLCWYIQGLPNASKLRKKLTQVKTKEEIKNIFIEFEQNKI